MLSVVATLAAMVAAPALAAESTAAPLELNFSLVDLVVLGFTAGAGATATHYLYTFFFGGSGTKVRCRCRATPRHDYRLLVLRPHSVTDGPSWLSDTVKLPYELVKGLEIYLTDEITAKVTQIRRYIEKGEDNTYMQVEVQLADYTEYATLVASEEWEEGE
jgi:hypothetical protein